MNDINRRQQQQQLKEIYYHYHNNQHEQQGHHYYKLDVLTSTCKTFRKVHNTLPERLQKQWPKKKSKYRRLRSDGDVASNWLRLPASLSHTLPLWFNTVSIPQIDNVYCKCHILYGIDLLTLYNVSDRKSNVLLRRLCVDIAITRLTVSEIEWQCLMACKPR